jgi:glycosyltransferase involved in cell wall biosynthesis
MAMKLTIIIPSHNAESTIDLAIKAVLRQKCRSEFEVIVVDDASTDGTREAARQFPVRLIALAANAGAGAARNAGAKSAVGCILLFVDSDVYLEPGVISQIEDFFDKNPEAAAVVGNYSEIPVDRGGCSMYHNFFTVYHHAMSGAKIEWFWGALSAIRKEDFDELSGFSDAYPGANAEDIELGYRLSEAGFEINFLPDLRGAHARKFSLGSMLYNDYHKAVLGLKLYWTRKNNARHPHGFSNFLNGFNTVIAMLSWPALLTSLFHGGTFYFFLFLLFAAANFRFYRFIQKRAGWLYVITSIPLHWATFNAIAAGAIGGAIGLIRGKGLESKSRWI